MNVRGILATPALCLGLCLSFDAHATLTQGHADFAGRDANFFRADRGPNEVAAGSVDFIRIYDNVLSQAQVYALMDPSQVPAPASGALMAMGLSLLGVAVAKGGRRTVVKPA